MNNLENLNNLEANENDNIISYKSLEQNNKNFIIIINNNIDSFDRISKSSITPNTKLTSINKKRGRLSNKIKSKGIIGYHNKFRKDNARNKIFNLCKKNFFSYINKRCIKKYNTKLLPIYNKIKKKQIKGYFSKTIKTIFYDCISKGYTLEEKKQNIENINSVLENEKNDPNSKIKILNILFNKTFLEIFRMYLYDKPFIELFHISKSVFFLIRFKTFKNDLEEYSITQKNIYIKNLEKYLASKDIILTAP